MSEVSQSSDPRWTKLHTEGVMCSCGQRHTELFPIHMLVPLGWPGLREYEPDAALRMDGDFLSENFSVREGRYFSVRMRLPLPLQGWREHALLFTAWAALDRPDFEGYVRAFTTNTMKQHARAAARLVNRIGGPYPDTFRLMGSAYQQTDGGSAYFLTDPVQEDGRNNHPLAIDQRQGITLDRLFDIYASHNHDMRPGFRSN